MAGPSAAGDGETIAPVTRNKHTTNPIHLFIVLFVVSLLCLIPVFAR
jgi:hypothetical protein